MPGIGGLPGGDAGRAFFRGRNSGTALKRSRVAPAAGGVSEGPVFASRSWSGAFVRKEGAVCPDADAIAQSISMSLAMPAWGATLERNCTGVSFNLRSPQSIAECSNEVPQPAASAQVFRFDRYMPCRHESWHGIVFTFCPQRNSRMRSDDDRKLLDASRSAAGNSDAENRIGTAIAGTAIPDRAGRFADDHFCRRA